MPRPRPAQVLARGVVGPLFRSLISRSRLPELTVPLRLGSYTLRFRPFTMGDLFVAAGIAREGLYEPEVLRVFKPEAGDVFVDVGAHIGFYTLRAARLVGPTGRVVSFEPNRESYSLLVRNVRANRLSNVVPLNIGVSDFVGKARLVSYKNAALGVDPAFSRLQPGTGGVWEGGGSVAVSDLDSVLGSMGIREVDWLKIDAEGHELHVLRGAMRTLESRRIRLIVEAEGRDAEEFLRPLGFRMKQLAVSPSGLFSVAYFYR